MNLIPDWTHDPTLQCHLKRIHHTGSTLFVVSFTLMILLACSCLDPAFRLTLFYFLPVFIAALTQTFAWLHFTGSLRENYAPTPQAYSVLHAVSGISAIIALVSVITLLPGTASLLYRTFNLTATLNNVLPAGLLAANLAVLYCSVTARRALFKLHHKTTHFIEVTP